jgi:hypothetical protein
LAAAVQSFAVKVTALFRAAGIEMKTLVPGHAMPLRTDTAWCGPDAPREPPAWDCGSEHHPGPVEPRRIPDQERNADLRVDAHVVQFNGVEGRSPCLALATTPLKRRRQLHTSEYVDHSRRLRSAFPAAFDADGVIRRIEGWPRGFKDHASLCGVERIN